MVSDLEKLVEVVNSKSMDYQVLLVMVDRLNHQYSMAQLHSFVNDLNAFYDQALEENLINFLDIIDYFMKNCGCHFQNCIAESNLLSSIADGWTRSVSDDLKKKYMEIVMAWSCAFKSNEKFKVLHDAEALLNLYGVKSLQLSDNIYTLGELPTFQNNDVCHKCDIKFTFIIRRHHCRLCGNTFCDDHSSKKVNVPQLKVRTAVRVCDECYGKINMNLEDNYFIPSIESNEKTMSTHDPQTDELVSNEEKMLSEALKRSEITAREDDVRRHSFVPNNKYIEKSHQVTFSDMMSSEMSQNTCYPIEDDVQLKAPFPPSNDMSPLVLNNFEPKIEMKPQQETVIIENAKLPLPVISKKPEPVVPESVKEDVSLKTVSLDVEDIQSSIDIFVNRIQSNFDRGRYLEQDSIVRNFYDKLFNQMNKKLTADIDNLEKERHKYENFQEKLDEVNDCRSALQLLRSEYDKKREHVKQQEKNLRNQELNYKLNELRKMKQVYYKKDILNMNNTQPQDGVPNNLQNQVPHFQNQVSYRQNQEPYLYNQNPSLQDNYTNTYSQNEIVGKLQNVNLNQQIPQNNFYQQPFVNSSYTHQMPTNPINFQVPMSNVNQGTQFHPAQVPLHINPYVNSISHYPPYINPLHYVNPNYPISLDYARSKIHNIHQDLPNVPNSENEQIQSKKEEEKEEAPLIIFD
ncbi:Hepatocyte growth factor-regulated tyrosine kinase substrate [Intoshia linei]|uniref:Hepatocyte growth factor-regulated tyrosine kinase substrate n=1 Tax=Intoshia linei TaxID=1819745 RepID=A0A177B2R4_9BILA|nr:Hepatocyte growth factor-regulated tyrosine kinase substrate [Intoshia linei]